MTRSSTLALLLLPLTAAPALAADCRSGPAAGVDWTECRKRNLMLDGSDLAGARLDRADFGSSDLHGATLAKASAHKAEFGRARLDGVAAAGASFQNAIGHRASFVKADLRGADFSKSEMGRVNFSSADMTGANLDKGDFGRAVFAGTRLDGVSFRFANLARADLRSLASSQPLDFTGSYLLLTRFENADLSGAIGLQQAQIDLACLDANTRLPKGLALPAKPMPCTDAEVE